MISAQQLTAAAPVGLIGKCSYGHVSRFTAEQWIAVRASYSSNKFGHTSCPQGCRTAVDAKPIKARITEKECDGRCTGAVGPACDCKCGGENHGGGHAA